MEIKIEKAQKHQAQIIARLIMLAMGSDCCLHFTGSNYTLDDFERVLTELVLMEESQYSYNNASVAFDGNGSIVGACVSYNGANLHKLRKPFIEKIKKNFNRDFSKIKDETTSGELYIDSLAVSEPYRKNGVATKLLKDAIAKAEACGIDAVGLLVDKNNPKAERLYNKIGFEYVDDSTWGGHEMKHLQFKIKR